MSVEDDQPVARGWVWMLRAAAAYNLIIALPGLFSASLPVGSPSDSDRVVSLLVACFGLVYLIISVQPRRFAPLLWTGVLGKLGVIAIMVPAVLAGRQPAALVPVLAGDALFTLAFIAFLLRGVSIRRG